jgi:type IV pilus assembly protein PilZ
VTKDAGARKFTRAQVSLAVHYRTKGSFLVSYSLNLSKGGLFLETKDLLPVGSKLTIRFTVPGATIPIETDATVMWVRESPSEDGQPAGLGLRFDRLDENIGASIDRLIQDFTGVRIMALASEITASARIARYMESVLTCNVSQDTISHTLLSGFGSRIDLVIIDLDSTGKEGLKAISAAIGAKDNPIPVIALSRRSELRELAIASGAEKALDNPPPFEELRQITLDVVGKPSRTDKG